MSVELAFAQCCGRGGVAAAIVSVAAWLVYADRLLEGTAAQEEPLYPSPR
jgi:hypothetical protein